MSSRFDLDPSQHFGGSAADRRAAALRLEHEREQARRQELDAQACFDTPPQERIRIWERLHALELPRSSRHPLLAVIAAQTRLSLRDVQEEQRRRTQR